MADGYLSLDPRLKIALPLQVEWLNSEGDSFRVRTFTDNISFGGICFVLDGKNPRAVMKVGQQLNIKANAGKINSIATVRHITTLTDGSMRIGAELVEPIFEWLSRYKHCNPELLRNIIPTTLSQPERRKK
jgi:hypothetical protein